MLGTVNWQNGTSSYSFVDQMAFSSGSGAFNVRYWVTTVWNESGLDMESGDSNTKDKVVYQNSTQNKIVSAEERVERLGGLKSVTANVYPNPFNPSTTISYDLPSSGHVELKVLDIFGREIAVLKDGNESSGRHYVRWNGKNRYGNSVASGMYFYQLIFQGKQSVGKLLLMKWWV